MLVSDSASNSFRLQIVQAIDALLNEPPQWDFYNQCINTITRQLLEQSAPFPHYNFRRYLLTSIAFGIWVDMIQSKEFQANHQALRGYRSIVLGEISNLMTITFKNRLHNQFGEREEQLYGKITIIVDALKTYLATSDLMSVRSSEYKSARSELHDQIYGAKEAIQTIHQYVISLIAHIALSITETPKGLQDRYDREASPSDSLLRIKNDLHYIETMMKKIEGQEHLYVDVIIVKEGFMLNLR